MKTPKLFFLVLLFFVFTPIFAQVGIGTTSPNASSLLDISATDKGVLIPRVALTSTTSFSPLLAHVAGMQVYNTATISDVLPGLYFNNGTKWIRVGDATANNYTFLRTSDDLPGATIGDNLLKSYRQGHTAFGNFSTNPDTSSYFTTLNHNNVLSVQEIPTDATLTGNDVLNGVNTELNVTSSQTAITRLRGVNSRVVLNGSVSSNNNVYGVFGETLTNTNGSMNSLIAGGNFSYTDIGGTGTKSLGVGVYGKILLSNALATTTNAMGVRSDILGNGNITNLYNFYGGNISTITANNGYGLYLEDVKATNDIGVFQAGADDNNYFAGNTKIGNTPSTTNANAILELESTNKGLLLPRIALTATSAFAPLTAHTAGMKIYNTATAVSATPSESVSPGEYVNDGTKWVRLADAATASNYTFLRTADNLPATTIGNQNVKAYRQGHTAFGNYSTDPDRVMVYGDYPNKNIMSVQERLTTDAQYDAVNGVTEGGLFALQHNKPTNYTGSSRAVNALNHVAAGSTVNYANITASASDARNEGSGTVNLLVASSVGASSINGTVGNAIGLNSYSTVGSGATITNGTALQGTVQTGGTGVMTNGYGIRSTVLGSNITNGYGLYVDDVSGTNNWGIYQKNNANKNYFAANTKIGDTPGTTNANAVLEVESTNKGILIPRLTTAQRTAIVSPTQSLMVYDSDVDLFYYYSTANAAWTAMNTGSVKAVSATTYTLLPADSGRVIEFSSVSAVTLTVPSTLPVGFQVSISQVGTGIVTFVASGGMVINNRWAATATSGQWAKAGLEVRATNSSILSGDVQ